MKSLWLHLCSIISISPSINALSSEKPRLFASTATASSTISPKKTISSSTKGQRTPKLIVFDLDNTLWTPELYQLRAIERSGKTPVAEKDVKLFDGAKAILENPPPISMAIASRTKSGAWAHSLLGQFQIRELFDYCEIFTGNKIAHFRNIQQQSGIAYEDMLFFDDARDGKYGNCEPVASLGVLCCHCPRGLYSSDIFDHALQQFKQWDGTANTIIEANGSMTKPNAAKNLEGRMKVILREKGYGFIQCEGQKDVYFRCGELPVGVLLKPGDAVSFAMETDTKTGRKRAKNIKALQGGSLSTVAMPTFSMNMPFAALLANGYKDIETRNGTMFTQYSPGTKFLLHVGKRIYPDGNKHLEIMRSGGLDDEEIARLKALPNSFGPGMVVAILEIGETFETSLRERSDPDMQRRIAAYGADAGKRATEIRRVQYLEKPVPVRGQPGVFQTEIPKEALPSEWLN